MNEFEYDVFLSHAGEDQDEVKQLYNELISNALNPYFQRVEEAENSPNIQDKLEKILSRSRLLLIYLTDNLIKKWPTKYELRAFLDFVNEKGSEQREIIFFSKDRDKDILKFKFLQDFSDKYKDVLKPKGSIFDSREVVIEYIRKTVGLLDLMPINKDWLRIGIGCCVWAAPIIRTLFDGRNNPERCGVTLYGFQSKFSRIPANYWYQYENFNTPYLIPFNGSDALNPNGRKWNSEAVDRAKLFNADDLLTQITRDRLDCIVVPSEVYELDPINKKLLKKVASIMHTFQGGCKLLIIGSDQKIINSFENLKLEESQNMVAFWNTISNECVNRNIKNIKVLLNKKTVLEKYYDEYFPNEYDVPPGVCIKENIALGNWKSLTDTLKDCMKEEKCFFLLAWEPQVRWIKNHLNEMYDIRPLELDFLKTFKDFTLPYLSFDIMLSIPSLEKWDRENQLDSYIKSLQAFFTTIESSIEGLNEEKKDIRFEAEQLSSFMWMEKPECERLLHVLNFKFMVYWEWMVKIEELIRDGKVALR